MTPDAEQRAPRTVGRQAQAPRPPFIDLPMQASESSAGSALRPHAASDVDPDVDRDVGADLHLDGVSVGVVVPAYRVAAHIEQVIRGIPRFVSAIVVVDDRSPDDTAARVERLADPRVTLLRHDENQGVGGAMVTGFRECIRQKLDIVVKMDGDDQMDPAHLSRILEPLLDGRADMVKGNRYSSIASLKQMPLVRVAGNAGLTFLVKMASGYWNTFDPANGYIAIRTSVLERLDLAQLPKRYFFESGFLIELGIQRAVIVDVPIPARYGDERSSLSVPRTLLGFPPRLVWGLVRRLFWRYFVHDFSAVSVFLLCGIPSLAFGIAYAAYWYWGPHSRGEIATAGDVMETAMPIILGVQFILQAVVLDVQGIPRTPLSPSLLSSSGDGAASARGKRTAEARER
jgi:glycosyltransferase involved in cell wall biosynthesis